MSKQKKSSYKNIISHKILGFSLSISSILGSGQEREMSIQEVFDLAIKNHPSLMVTQSNIELAKQNTKVAKNAYLPEITLSAQAMHLGNLTLLDTDFSKVRNVDIPNFGNNFSIEAKQLLWKGGAVQNAVKIRSLQEELAQLSHLNKEQEIKLLTLEHYLNLYKIQNQIKVYQKNIQQANDRLKNIQKFYQQGMITRNDIIRGELLVSNLNLALQTLENNRQILNYQLNIALGLPRETQIIANESIGEKIGLDNIEDYQQGLSSHPVVQSLGKAVEIQESNLKIIKSEKMPTIAAFAGNSLQRPLLTSTPVLDMYRNSWNVGLSLTYNLDNLYKSSQKIKQSQLEIQKANAQIKEATQLMQTAVDAAFIKYNEALVQNNTLMKNRDLAQENYRIMESKYNNQLAILLDMIDASNAKLDAELQVSNSEINIIMAYYKLLKESGKL